MTRFAETLTSVSLPYLDAGRGGRFDRPRGGMPRARPSRDLDLPRTHPGGASLLPQPCTHQRFWIDRECVARGSPATVGERSCNSPLALELREEQTNEFMGCDGWPSRVSGLRHTKNFHVVQAKQGERRGIGHSRVLVETFSTTSILHRPILPHVCIVQLHSPTVTRLGSRACRASAGTKALLRLTRSHRRIENGLH